MVHLSEAGRVADACWLAIPAHFPNVDLDAYSIQPDHLHGIITLRKSGSQHPVGAQHVAPLPSSDWKPRRFDRLIPGSLPVIMRAYKAAVTRLLHLPAPVWQRGYYESMLRDGA
jgi:REP element-mobilizing transposase RayT